MFYRKWIEIIKYFIITSYKKDWLRIKLDENKLDKSQEAPLLSYNPIFNIRAEKRFTCSKSTTDLLEKGVRYVQS